MTAKKPKSSLHAHFVDLAHRAARQHSIQRDPEPIFMAAAFSCGMSTGRRLAFRRRVDAMAYFDAALMMMPVGYYLSGMRSTPTGRWYVALEHMETKEIVSSSDCPSPGLALFEAVMIAHAATVFDLPMEES